MNIPGRSERALHSCAVLLALVLPALPVHARPAHGDAWARGKFSAAERAREALNVRPAGERTRRDYQRVLDAYRRVYFGAPTSTKADPSVVAVAELLVEMGRHFDDDKILLSAIDQYKFLRREYPGSKYRFDALFTIGEIHKDDLDDPDQARAAFDEFLRRYPRNRLADDARDALNEISQEQARKEEAAQKEKEAAGRKATSRPDKAARDEVSRDDEGAVAESGRRKPPRVTGIRHWSTPDYTRVAIDLEQEVKFESQRIAHPDRIFFDLRDTQLASTLLGKSFDVDDGFLKKIRVAQYKPGRTRVVLEVDDLSDYNAFLLPNPYRLIIDIHGKQGGTRQAAKESSAVLPAKGDSDRYAQPVRDGSERTARTAAPVSSEEKPTTATLKRCPDSDRGAPVGCEAAPDAVVETGSRTSAEGASAAIVAAGKPNAQSAAGPNSVLKKIVTADDENEVTQANPAHSKRAQVSAPVTKAASDLATTRLDNGTVRSRTKHKTADGNDDEVATLEPPDLPVSPKSSAPLLNLPSAPSKTRAKGKRKASMAEIEGREAQPTSSGDRSLIRALGLKIGRIVIDPGHGGHDTGTIGPDGLMEKDVVLDVAKRLGRLLETRMGAEVIYTRQDDTFVPLETRTAIANQEQADLFVSIHANSSSDRAARGVETYYLNFTSNPDALEVAARENAVSEKSIHELQDLVKRIALKEKMEESREFAGDVQHALHTGLVTKSPGIRNRGVKKAPFIVLIGANMPSILAEISFVSNPTDEHKLETAEYRQRVGESLYRGIAKYVSGLSGVKVASRIAKSESQ